MFVRLHEKGLVYRGNRIINWCPRCLTALSDEEAEPAEHPGKLWHLRYPLAQGVDAPGLPRLPDGRPYLVVATTRPETMLGDTGVAVHPEDERYAAIVGKEIDLPLAGRRIPIVADTYVDPEFGSGAVKMTPAHDPNDFDVAQRTGLPALNVMTPEASMNDEVPEAFRGMDRSEARRAVVAAFDAARAAGKGGGAHARGAALLPLRHRGGAAAERPVVRQHEAAGRAGAAGVARRRAALSPRALRQGLRALDGEHPGLVHQPPALVGAPHPRLVLPGGGMRGDDRRA